VKTHKDLTRFPPMYCSDSIHWYATGKCNHLCQRFPTSGPRSI